MKIHELLADPKAWTKGAAARDQDDNIVSVCDESAVKWCLLGSVVKCYPPSEVDYIISLIKPRIDVSISSWNDSLATHDDIINLCKELNI